jgi:uncharacterized membrane protein YidH (DUF202 family)
MSRKNIAILLIMGLFALLVYAGLSWNATTSGIETKGGSDPSLIVQFLSLATAVVSLLTAIVGLLKGTRKGSSADT